METFEAISRIIAFPLFWGMLIYMSIKAGRRNDEDTRDMILFVLLAYILAS
jgi:hypothetical protein